MRTAARLFLRSKCPIAVLISVSLICPLLPARAQTMARPAKPQRGYASRLKHDTLLSLITFKTPSGDILLTLPADLRAGDAVSGSIQLKPKGADLAQKTVNAKLLSEYQIAIGAQTVSTEARSGQWTLPAVTEAVLVLKQKDASDTQSALISLPLLPAPIAPPFGTSSSPAVFPLKGQADRPLALPAQCEADWQSLRVLIGGKDAGFLAASPRAYFVQTPPDVFGKTMLQVRRGDTVTAETAYRNDRVRQGCC